MIEDDLAPIMDKMKNADMLVFATPVYFSDLSESLKSFLDRVRRVTRKPEERALLEGKPTVGICVAGGGGGGSYACAHSLDRVLVTCGFDVVDIVPVRRQNLKMKLRLLELTGEWLVGKK